MSKFVVEKNIPMPAKFGNARSGASIYPFAQMTEVGDSFALPYEEGVSEKGNPTNTYSRMRGVVSQRNKRDTSKRFDLARDGDTVRVWLVAITNATEPAVAQPAAAPVAAEPAPVAPAPTSVAPATAAPAPTSAGKPAGAAAAPTAAAAKAK